MVTCRRIAVACEGLSGRALRKLPFLAFSQGTVAQPCSVDEFMQLLAGAVMQETSDRASLQGGGP
jgi:pachytene checkpoint protein 2